jgi:hypothetical protein
MKIIEVQQTELGEFEKLTELSQRTKMCKEIFLSNKTS